MRIIRFGMLDFWTFEPQYCGKVPSKKEIFNKTILPAISSKNFSKIYS
jgi:hypothetical protein